MPKIENIIDTTENCRYCLMCRHIAPMGVLTNNESYTPHGIALIIASQRRGMIAWNEETINLIYSDPDGGNSRAHCITDQPLPAAVAAVRAQLAAQGLAPEAARTTHDKLSQHGNPYGSAVDYTVGSGETALYLSDDALHLWPGAIDAALKLLAALDVAPVHIGRGRNNGLLASSLGYPDTAVKLVQAVANDVQSSGARMLLVLSPGDVFAFGQMADERLGLPFPADVALVDVIQHLADAHAEGRLALTSAPLDEPYAYVDPTHAVRVPQRFDAPRQLLAAIHGEAPRELFWRRERAHPVGSTHLQYTRPDLAEKLTRARLADAHKIGARVLYCEDPATLHHLNQYAPDYDLRVAGLFELLADHLAT